MKLFAKVLPNRTSYIILVFAYFLGLTIIFSWPLAQVMDTSLVGKIGDNVYFVWLFGWFKKAIFELHTSPFIVPFLNYPQGWSLAHTEMSPATLALGLPFSFFWGDVFAYNFSALATFVLSGFFMYLWIEHETKSHWAGIIAGSFFAFSPYRLAHFRAGHLNLLGTMWLPLFFMGFTQLLRGETTSRRMIWLTGIALGLTGLSSIYYLYAALLICLFAMLVYLLFNRELVRSHQFWLQGAAAFLISAPIIVLAVLPFALLETQGGLQSRDVFKVVGGSASLTDFILPSTDHFLLGSWIGEHFSRDHWIEGTLYPGLVATGLVIYGLVRRPPSRSIRRLLLLLLLVGGFGFFFALGTHLYWNEQIVDMPLPSILQGTVGREAIHIRLPVFYLYQFFPMFSRLRTFKRFAIFLLLAISALAGLGTEQLRKRIPTRVWPVVGLAIVVFGLLEFYPGTYKEFAQVQARPVDTWLAEQPGNGAVAQFPFYEVEDQDQVYNTLIHGKPFIGGFFNAFPPAQYLRIRPVMEGFPDEASLDLLRDLNMEYILVDSSAYQNFAEVQETLADLGLTLTIHSDHEFVYQFAAQ